MASPADIVGKDDGSWITSEFLQEILDRDDPSGKVSVVSCDAKSAVGKGENYQSSIFRVEIHYKHETEESTEKCHLIVKSLPVGEFLVQYMIENGVFEREINIYHTALPALRKFAQGRLHSKPIPDMFPKAFETSRPNTVVLEDLKYQDFTMADRKQMLDLQHCRLVLKRLAFFHATSAAFEEHNPGIVSKNREALFSERNREFMNMIFPLQLNILLKKVESWPGFESYATKLKKFIPNLLDSVIKSHSPEDSKFNVLNHGDCWINNFLFKYSLAKEPIELRLVDFQQSVFGSPAIDLSYFLYTSPQSEVRSLHFDQLLQEYHDELCGTLTFLGSNAEVFSFSDLKNEMKRMSSYGLLSSVSMMHLILANPDDVPDLSKMTDMKDLGDQSMWQNFQTNTRFDQIFQQLLPHFDEIGVFD